MSIDPQQFGELMADVKHIKSMVTKNDGEIDVLKKDVGTLKRWQAAVMAAWATAGAAGSSFIHKFIG